MKKIQPSEHIETIYESIEDYAKWFEDNDPDDKENYDRVWSARDFFASMVEAKPNKETLKSFQKIINMYKEEETRHYLEGCDWIESEKDEKNALKQAMNTDHMLKHLMVLEQWIKKAKKVV